MATTLKHGAYEEECPLEALQVAYMAGGYPGCGGYCEALELQTPTGTVYLLQEFRHDCDGRRYRWLELSNREDLDNVWKRAWVLCGQESDPWSDWFPHPWWEERSRSSTGHQ